MAAIKAIISHSFSRTNQASAEAEAAARVLLAVVKLLSSRCKGLARAAIHI
jgi:hypothetical protein